MRCGQERERESSVETSFPRGSVGTNTSGRRKRRLARELLRRVSRRRVSLTAAETVEGNRVRLLLFLLALFRLRHRLLPARPTAGNTRLAKLS